MYMSFPTLITYLTQWTKFLVYKSTGAYLVTEFPFMEEKSLLRKPVIGICLQPVESILTTCCFDINPNIILPSGILHKVSRLNVCINLIFPHAFCMSYPPHPPWFVYFNI
jgi:hypothetical protein